MIQKIGNMYVLETKNTCYAFRIMPTGHLEHLYYGKKIRIVESSEEVLREKHAFAPGNSNCYDKKYPFFSLEDIRLEMSSYGKGDIREPFIEVVHADGSCTSDFLFREGVISTGKEELEYPMPSSYDDSNRVMHLCITLEDAQYQLELKLHYYVYEDCDVITRNACLINQSEESVTLNRLMSMQLDLERSDYQFTTFNGGWAREMKKQDIPLSTGRFVNSSYTGTSSSRANPFVMLSRVTTTEDLGECYGFNLVYSGNHMEVCEVSSFGKTRIITGINPQSFAYLVEPGDSFISPEAVMIYSNNGYNGMSKQMHAFVREHIVRGEWKKKERPVLLNSWEASYFDINESKLVNLAKAGKSVGIELFVMDDGWFGTRDDDAQSLGDWEVNPKKLPNGLAGLANKIKALGMDFGIWVEPEMVNVNSNLYRAHPEWAISIPGKPHAEGRNQRILDLCNEEVQDYIIETMTKVFSSADISYVKWDMNRTFTDYYSQVLPKERQGEVAHRYYLGLYRCMRELTKRFPHILFEGCSAGGNRFDLGILSFFPQIWASDNTDALCRVTMQHNYSYGYPMSTVSAHVSACPNHQTLRTTPLETRFHVAAFGVCGYECNFCDMKKEELAAIAVQIGLYKEWRAMLQYGDFYRGRNLEQNELTEWTCVDADQKRAVGMIMQATVKPNTPYAYYCAKGLKEDTMYHFYNRDLKYNMKEFGDLVNTVSPIHIKPDSLLHNLLAKFIKMDGEKEACQAYGDLLMQNGVWLKQGFSATGYNEEIRFFPDFGSRMYFMVAEDD